jgi:hypothetical protein
MIPIKVCNKIMIMRYKIKMFVFKKINNVSIINELKVYLKTFNQIKFVWHHKKNMFSFKKST